VVGQQNADIAGTLQLRDVAMATIFGFLYMGTHWRHLANLTESSMCACDAALCQFTLSTCSISCWVLLLVKDGVLFLMIQLENQERMMPGALTLLFGNTKGIWPFKTCSSYSRKFSLAQSWGICLTWSTLTPEKRPVK